MKFLRHFLTVLALGALCAMALAQESGKKSDHAMGKDKKSDMAMGMPTAKPSAEMQRMSKMLAGTWNVTETYEATDMTPKGGTGSGMATIKAGPGGLLVIEDYKSHGSTGSFAGHGVFWWDDKAQAFKTVWCDNTTPGGCSANGVGKFEGDDLVFKDEEEMMGKKTQLKEVLTASGSSITEVVMSSEDGAPMQKMMTVKYSKPAMKHEATPAAPGN